MKGLKTILLLLFLTSSVHAGQIYGRLKRDGRPVANTKFEITCGRTNYGGTTDRYGAYSIKVGRGKCTFTLDLGNPKPIFPFYTYNTPLRFDFEVVLKNGTYSLRRR